MSSVHPHVTFGGTFEFWTGELVSTQPTEMITARYSGMVRSFGVERGVFRLQVSSASLGGGGP